MWFASSLAYVLICLDKTNILEEIKNRKTNVNKNQFFTSFGSAILSKIICNLNREQIQMTTNARNKSWLYASDHTAIWQWNTKRYVTLERFLLLFHQFVACPHTAKPSHSNQSHANLTSSHLGKFSKLTQTNNNQRNKVCVCVSFSLPV